MMAAEAIATAASEAVATAAPEAVATAAAEAVGGTFVKAFLEKTVDLVMKLWQCGLID